MPPRDVFRAYFSYIYCSDELRLRRRSPFLIHLHTIYYLLHTFEFPSKNRFHFSPTKRKANSFLVPRARDEETEQTTTTAKERHDDVCCCFSKRALPFASRRQSRFRRRALCSRHRRHVFNGGVVIQNTNTAVMRLCRRRRDAREGGGSIGGCERQVGARPLVLRGRRKRSWSSEVFRILSTHVVK